MILTEKALSLAVQSIGVKEDPLGSNRGPQVDEYVRSVGLDPAGHYPWCAAFLHYCFQRAATQLWSETGEPVANPCPRTGAALGLWRLARPEWKLTVPKVGAIFVMDFGHGTGHVGLVEQINGNRLTTVEGNTNLDGSREGIGVFRRQRSIAAMLGFVYFGA